MYSLILVGCLYLLSGLWCSFQSELAAQYLGFGLNSVLAKSEFLSVYGGLQCGLATALLACAARPAYREAAVFFALCFSLVLALFRLGSMLAAGFASSIDAGALPLLLLEWALVLVLAVSYCNRNWRLTRQSDELP